MWENHITLRRKLYRLSVCGMKLTETIKDRIKGCVYGQAIGDALGLGTEFMSCEEVRRCYPDGLERYDQMVRDDHRSRWKPGSWTDDTDMMVCIAKARRDNHFDLNQVAHNFKEWFSGNPLGIGRHTYNVLCFADYTKDPMKAADIVWRLYRCRSAANGGLMRTSIVGTSPLAKDEEIANICRLTHPDMRCVGSCVLYVKLIQGLIFRDEQLDISALKAIAVRYDERIEEYIEQATYDDPLSWLWTTTRWVIRSRPWPWLCGVCGIAIRSRKDCWPWSIWVEMRIPTLLLPALCWGRNMASPPFPVITWTTSWESNCWRKSVRMLSGI